MQGFVSNRMYLYTIAINCLMTMIASCDIWIRCSENAYDSLSEDTEV
jgi:hypothetical protein